MQEKYYISKVEDDGGVVMELWDAYNLDGTLAGFDIIRGEKIPFNYFHMVCEAVIQHIDGDYLLMQRSYNKEIYPGKWEIGAGGSALKGENNIEAVWREIKEETGIDTGELKEIYTLIHQKHQAIYYGYLLKTACKKDAIQLQENETIDYKWISQNELFDFYNNECSLTLKERLKDYIDSILYNSVLSK